MTESITTDGSYIVARIGLGDATQFEKMSETAYRIEGENSMLVNPDNPISFVEGGLSEDQAIARAAELNAARVQELSLNVAAAAAHAMHRSSVAESFASRPSAPSVAQVAVEQQAA